MTHNTRFPTYFPLPLVRGDLPLIGEVGLVAHQHDDDVAAPLRPHVVYPLAGLVE